MWIKAKDKEGQTNYINASKFVTRFTVEKDSVTVWGEDNLSLSIEKTKELQAQLESLLIKQSSPGFENLT